MALDEAQQSLQWCEAQRLQRVQEIAALMELASAVKQEYRTFRLAVTTDLRKLTNLFAPMREAFAMLHAEAKVPPIR